MSTERGFVTKGTAEYFADREAKIQAHIDEATTKIDEIEGRVRAELAAINAERSRLREHLTGFIAARNTLAQHRNTTADLIVQLQAMVAICDADLPALDSMLDELESETAAADARLGDAEKGRARQLKKHTRSKARYELRKVRLDLRKRIVVGGEAGQ